MPRQTASNAEQPSVIAKAERREVVVSVEFRDLQWAVVAAQHRSLRQAARALNVRQSTLSRGLRALEHHLGAFLFERTNGGTRPTMEGLEFIEAARRILDDTSAMTERLKNRSRGESGELTIGVHASLSAGNLRATLIEHRYRFPGVDTHLVDGSSDHLIADLNGSAIDVAFIASNRCRWEGRVLPVWSERVVIALPEHHALGEREVVGWSDLKRETFILPEQGPGPELLQLLINRLGRQEPYRIMRHDASLDQLLTLVGVGCGALLALEGATGLIYPGVTFREVHDADGPSRLDFRAYWRTTNPKPSLQTFLGMLRERYPDISDGQVFSQTN